MAKEGMGNQELNRQISVKLEVSSWRVNIQEGNILSSDELSKTEPKQTLFIQ